LLWRKALQWLLVTIRIAAMQAVSINQLSQPRASGRSWPPTAPFDDESSSSSSSSCVREAMVVCAIGDLDVPVPCF